MLQLHNASPFAAAMFGLPDQRGVDTLVVVVKATFDLDAPPRLAEQQRPISLVDEYHADPTASSLRYPSEVHLEKPGTDVLVLGDACAPRGQAVTELDVAVGVGQRRKLVRVHGDRSWIEGHRVVQPSRAQPFVRMPIIYERAYGGRIAAASPRDSAPGEPRNPVGVGWLGARHATELLGTPVPNIEDPSQPLAWLGQESAPVGLAAIAPSWQPRLGFAGTYDQRWRETRAPYLPTDFDPRFFQTGSAGLSFEPRLHGGEPVTLDGFDPDRRWQLSLPRCQIDVSATVSGDARRLQAVLDTVLFEPSQQRFTMTWRATLSVAEQLLRVERVDVGLNALEGVGEAQGGER